MDKGRLKVAENLGAATRFWCRRAAASGKIVESVVTTSIVGLRKTTWGIPDLDPYYIPTGRIAIKKGWRSWLVRWIGAISKSMQMRRFL